jgi:DNA topoisomerase-1
MAKTLVIVESPTKAKTISKFLGSGYTVESSFGHIRDLPKSKMGVDIEHGSFLPTYVIPKDKAKQVKLLKDKAKKSAAIIFATDEDREGEAISWHLANVLDIDPKDAKRIVFHEITKKALTDAIEHPRGIDLKLVDAQQARRVLDRLVGYELSPLLWQKIARGLSAGRVQSVAVRLVVEREREILAFVPQNYWSIEGDFLHADAPHPIHAALVSMDGKKLDTMAIASQEHADAILAELNGASYAVQSTEKKEARRAPPPPFTTSTLQQQANHKLGFSSKQTMRLAQQLYEGVEVGAEGSVGLITYMRTDSVNLAESFVAGATAHIESAYGKPYAVDAPRRYATKSKGAQEAHEAIRPTDPARTPDMVKASLTPQQHRLYTLIWKRAVATQMAEVRLEKTILNINALRYGFRANGVAIQFDGWSVLYPDMFTEETVPVLADGAALAMTALSAIAHATEPPARYSDATLVKAMEEYGIGRPSTYAPTIATIEDRGYVSRDDHKRLAPTDIGMVVNDMLVTNFPQIVD